MRHIVLLGSTGSIGTQTLDVIRHQPECAKVEALAAGGGRIPLLEEQTREFMPRLVAVYDEKAAADLRVRLQDTPVRVVSGMAGLLEACAMEEADMVVTAMVGMIGLEPTVEAIRRHKTIALANKETLVCAGALIMRMAQEEGVQILPVDSEHSAIFQCLDGRGPETVRRILLTASGGPFRGWTWEQLVPVRPEQALKHPNWSMGAKITIDSATMMNKGLEMIEAKWLFGVRPEQIEVVVHPQSIVHSAVEFTNGSVIAQMGVPDMRLPIQEALEYPVRGALTVEPLDLFQKSPLTFEKPDEEVFRSIRLAREALIKGGLYPAVFNAANEKAVAEFLAGTIGFTEIFSRVEEALERYDALPHPDVYTLEDVLEIGRSI
ncbi:MAG: 1-deoxy-D-xylulose-5-phosphate reductoisomerase [Clostridiales bacterium]|nr:1-deoxy-D-xylulose-5-phosphate reductoisomerase [Clostridiales bacterium]